MIRGFRPHKGGYTIIEVIIVLTITSALLISSILLFNTRIPKTQFTNAVNEFDSKLRDTATEVVNGYYPTSDLANQGTRQGKIYLGRAIQFGPAINGCSASASANCDNINLYTVFGNRLTTSTPSRPVISLAEAVPRADSTGGFPVATESLGYGLHITRVKIEGSATTLSGLAFLQTFGSSVNTGTNTTSGASQIQVIPIAGSIGVDGGVFSGIPAFTDSINAASPNPTNGIAICLKGGGNSQYAIITVGGSNRATGTKVEFIGEGTWNGRCS